MEEQEFMTGLKGQLAGDNQKARVKIIWTGRKAEGRWSGMRTQYTGVGLLTLGGEAKTRATLVR